ncbi:MAG: 1-(5-phosphoribosyl)-5-[(5-phosphoribosylamino)methylideneamino]imidazole-4-carboxamide isomerase [Gammaproteobacteria bacterium]
MLLIPAIDIKDGKCVRLRQGRMEDATIFGEDPSAMAARWIEAGAKRLHIVDLDGATSGRPANADLIKDITEQFPDVPVQVGGGIRDEETVLAYLEAGVQYTIIGTRAISEPHFVNDLCLEFPGHIIVGLDAKNGKVAIAGWSKLSNHDVVDMAMRFEQDGVAAIIYTDIDRDGMMGGVNVGSTVELARAIHIPVIASGGVTSLDDIKVLCQVEDEGVEGVIIGRALYEGAIDLAKAQALVDDRG